MMDKNNLYHGISKCAWAYFFLYFDINLGLVSILPDFVAFLLFLSAIGLLKEEERELGLLIPLGDILAGWYILQWLVSWVGRDLNGLIPGLDIVICLANLYFHFQLLTNLAAIAAKYQSEGAGHDRKLLKYRTMQTILFTVMMVLSYLSTLFGEIWAYISIAIGAVYLIAGLCMMAALFDLRKEFALKQL